MNPRRKLLIYFDIYRVSYNGMDKKVFSGKLSRKIIFPYLHAIVLSVS